jgi:CheY-like chemotaxis protein
MSGGTRKAKKEADILLIVHGALMRDLLAKLLKERGHRVLTCAVGSDGITRFVKKKKHFDLVLCDVSLPRMSGFCVAKRIKEMSQTTTIILVKGIEDELNIGEFKESGADLVISGPLCVDEAIDLMERAIESGTNCNRGA